MPRPRLRFRPPPLELTRDVEWVLLRAFAPLAAPAPAGLDAPACHRLATRLDLAPRIAHRMGRAALAAELGEEEAARFHRDRQAAAANALRLSGLAREAAAAAAELGMPVVLLKFAALQLAGVLPPGSRGAADVDLLVPAARARDLHQALVRAGWRAAPQPEEEHQLPAVVHPAAGTLEIHRSIPGVRVGATGAAGDPGDRSAGVEDLAAHGLLVPIAELPGRCARPVAAVLVAHALVHGIAQHGHQPAAYPPLRTIADLIDLGLAGAEGAALAAAASPFVAADLSPEEVDAARELAAALAAGTLPAAGGGGAALLAHAVAGCLDPDYALAQRLDLFARQPSDRPRPVQLAATLWRTLAPTGAQLDALYGPAPRPAERWLRRLARPFDLVRRLVRYRAGRRRLARRGRG